jgi:hypothetical protein
MHYMLTHDHLPPPAMCDGCGVYIRTGDEWEAHFEAMMSRSKQDKQGHRQLERPTEIVTVETNPDGFRKCINVGLGLFCHFEEKFLYAFCRFL